MNDDNTGVAVLPRGGAITELVANGTPDGESEPQDSKGSADYLTCFVDGSVSSRRHIIIIFRAGTGLGTP
jgi:hypothetical protein